MTTSPEPASARRRSAGAARSLRLKCLLALVATTLALLATEGALRIAGQTDADGNWFLLGRHIGPTQPPITEVRGKLAPYLESDDSRMIHDSHLGWSPRPGHTTHGGMYQYNRHGVRVGKISDSHDREADPARLRIALFGDSFTHCDNVPFRESWGAYLQQMLRQQGLDCEVINFGVSAYGMDQAYLRWKHLGAQFDPDMVLFGFQAENVNRNVNLLRGWYAIGSGIPFSKPRFILDADGGLELINVPTLPLTRIPEVMAEMQSWPLAEHEWFYTPGGPGGAWWSRSRLAMLVLESLGRSPADYGRGPMNDFHPDHEPARVTLRLLTQWDREVRGNGNRFVIVHLPTEADLNRRLSKRPLLYADLLEAVRDEFPVIDPEPRLLEAGQNEGLAPLFVRRHYSDTANRIIAAVLAEHPALRSEASPAARPVQNE